MNIWEYPVEVVALEFGRGAEWSIHESPHGENKLAHRFNEFGKFGWELVSVLPVLSVEGTALIPPTVYAIFKRIKR